MAGTAAKAMRPDLSAILARHELTRSWLAAMWAPSRCIEHIREAQHDRAVLLDYVTSLEARLTEAVNARWEATKETP